MTKSLVTIEVVVEVEHNGLTRTEVKAKALDLVRWITATYPGDRGASISAADYFAVCKRSRLPKNKEVRS